MQSELSPEFLSKIYEIVLRMETSDSRFENFCKAIVSHIEGGAPVYGTSASWDLGRDAVGYGRAEGIYVCASLRDDVDAKAISDLERLTSTTQRIKRVYFCSSHNLSEHGRDRVAAAVTELLDGKFPLAVLGSLQLSEAAVDEDRAFKRNYGPELRSAISISQPASDNAEMEGMRLALISSTAEDSQQVRAAIYQAAILDAVESGVRTADSIAKDVAAKLKLSHSLPGWVVMSHLKDLEKDGLVVTIDGLIEGTAAGKEKREENERSAAERLLIGRKEIQAALEEALSTVFIPDDFARIWKVFEEKLAYSLYSRGMAIVEEVNILLNSVERATNDYRLSFVDELADSVAAVSGHGFRGEVVRDALRDLFADRTGPAAAWLVQVCASFVAACALGLEQTSAQAVRQLLARTTLVLDTDVVLSLLGEGEPEHVASETIVEAWRANGGRILVAEPVLLEVAYHAHIATSDYEQTRHSLPGTPEYRLRAIDNVFVRSYAELLSRGLTLPAWRDYIDHYRGRTPYSFDKVLGLLRGDYGVQSLPARSSSSEGFFEEVRLYLLEQAEQSNPLGMSKEVRDKARRDAELYVSFAEYLDATRQGDSVATAVLVSGGRRLAAVERRFNKAGEDHVVISVASALLLVSMLPGFSLGLSAMKSFLFDERRPGFSSDLDRTIVRMVMTSNERMMPWAKRGVLARTVRKKLIEVAHEQGERKQKTDREIIAAALNPANKPNTIQMLAESLDAIDVESRHERRARELAAQVEALKAELERERRKRAK